MLDVNVTFQNGAKQTLGMLDAIVTFQDGVDLEPTDNLFFSISRAWNMRGPPTNTQRLNLDASPSSTPLCSW